MANWNQGGGGGGGRGGSGAQVDFNMGIDRSDDNDNDFFTGTFDDPGEPGFSGPSYEGQFGTDSEGTRYTTDDLAHADWYEFSKFESALDKIDALTNRSFNNQTAVLGSNMEVRGYSPYGGRYGYDDAAFFSRAIGERGVAGDIYRDRPEGFKEKAVSFVENAASGLTERFGTSFTKNYAIDPREGYVGEITEDYAFTDFVGNLIGTAVPGGAKVDRYSSRELTKTGLGQRQFGNYALFSGAIEGGYAMTPEEEEAMFAAAQAEAEAERARGGEPTVEPAVTEGVAAATSQQRLRSALLPAFMQTDSFAFNLLGPELLPPVYDAAQDFFRTSTLVSGGDFGSVFGMAEGGQAGPEPQGNENVSGPVGFVGDVPEGVSEAGTVADDVPMEVEEGTYILNAAAVEFAGSEDIKKMILQAISEAERQGVDIQQNVDRIKLDNQVSLLVSRGEVVIPPKIAKIIGYDRLEKINNRGKQEVEKRVAENGQSPEADALDEQPANPAEGMTMSDGGVSVSGQGSSGPKETNVNLSAEAQGDGFIARPRVNYSEQKNTKEFPDGVIVNEKGKNIGFALDGQMFLSDDKSLRAGIEQQKSSSKSSAKLPAEYGGETIEFGSGSKMKRYNMGATFGPVDVDLSKTQVPNGDDVIGGSVRYRFSESGDVTLEATDDGRSGRIGLNYRF